MMCWTTQQLHGKPSRCDITAGGVGGGGTGGVSGGYDKGGQPTRQPMVRTGLTPTMCWTTQQLHGKPSRCDIIAAGGAGGGGSVTGGWGAIAGAALHRCWHIPKSNFTMNLRTTVQAAAAVQNTRTLY